MAETFISNDIIRQKLEQAVEQLGKEGVDLWINFVQETAGGAERAFSYISPGNLTWESAILVSKGGGTELICGKLDQKDFEDSGLFDRLTLYVEDFKPLFFEALKRESPKTVAVNFSLTDYAADGISHGKYLHLEEMLKEALPGTRIVSAESIIGALISQKTPLELDAIREGVAITAEILDEISDFLKPGLTEKQVYDFIQERMGERNLEPSFPTLVFAGDRGGGMGHASVTDNDIRPGDLVHVDMGVMVRGYASDMQRTWYVLKPGEESTPVAVQKGFDTIVRAIEETGKALKPGAKGVDIDAISRKIVVDAGYPEYPHALGHQVGQHVHDGGAMLGPAWPRYRSTPLIPLAEGQVFTLEPSLNVPGHGAVGLEDDVVVTPEGAQYLTEPQKELWFIR